MCNPHPYPRWKTRVLGFYELLKNIYSSKTNAVKTQNYIKYQENIPFDVLVLMI